MRYEHTQKSPLYLVLCFVAALLLVSAWWTRTVPVSWGLLTGGFMFGLLALSFRELSVRDGGEHLLVQFGPLPIFRTRIPYDRIESVRRGRTTWLDGWGIHLSPRGGWTWNLWGFDCVEVTLSRNRKLHIGTDEPESLEAFLAAQIRRPSADSDRS